MQLRDGWTTIDLNKRKTQSVFGQAVKEKLNSMKPGGGGQFYSYGK